MRALLAPIILVPLVLAAGNARAQSACDDAALSQAAAELALAGSIDADALVPAAQRHGSEAPVVHARIEREGDAGRAAWLTRLSRRHEAVMTCGEAQTGERRIVLAAPHAGSLRVLSEDRVEVSLESGFERPILVVADADGELVHLDATGGTVRLPDRLMRPLRVQLVAVGPSGPRPIAERSVGEAPTPDADDDSDREARPGRVARFPSRGTLAERVAGWRAASERSPLRPNRILDGVADRHASAVCDAARVAHVGPGGDPRARLRTAGIEARHVGEVVGRARDERSALEGLARSPSHRAALLDRRFTDVGVGSATDSRGGHCVVVLLAAWPRVLVR